MATRLPGVIVRIVPETAQITLPAFPRYVCIIGQGEHRLRVNNEEVVRSSSASFDYLSKRPFDSIIRVGLVPDADDFITPDDYTVYTEAGQNVGIQWSPLIPAQTDDTKSQPITGPLPVPAKIYIAIDGRPLKTIVLDGLSTATDIANAINSTLSSDPDYGTSYSNVAQVFDTNKVRLKSPNLPGFQGEKSSIRAETGPDDVFEIIFGDYTEYPPSLLLKGKGKRPDSGKSYFVTYRYIAGDETYEPTLYFDLKPLLEEHGSLYLDDPSNPNHINEIALMAQLAFQDMPGRIPGIVVLQLDFRTLSDPYNPNSFQRRTAFINAISKLERMTQGKLYIIPATTDEEVISALFNHVRVMSDPAIKAERMLLITMPQGSSVNDYIGPNGAAKFNSERVMLFYPSEIFVNMLNQTMPNYFGPLVYAAKKTAFPIGSPINVETLPGITLQTPATYNEKKALITAGVSVIDLDGVNTIILHGITTRTDFVIYEEENVVDIADYVKSIWRDRMFRLYKNAPITKETLSSVVSTSIALLETLKRDRLITDYKDIVAVQDSVEPRMVRMRGKIMPMFHVLYMDIEFVFSTTI